MSRRRAPHEVRDAWKLLGYKDDIIQIMDEEWRSASREDRQWTISLTVLELLSAIAENFAPRT